MSGLASWNYRCEDCDRVFIHTYEPPRPKTVACSCGAVARWTYCRPNVIHPTHSGRKYGEFDPQYGCVVEDYAHRQRLLKERGWEELPPLSVEEARHGSLQGEGAATDDASPPVLKADSLDEIEKSINQDMVDRKLTGERERRPMQESWIEI